MGSMSRMGESMAKKPAVPLLIVLVITAASLGMIAYDPPSFDMNEDSFMPDNDITRASTVVSEAFTSSASVMSTIDASGTAGGDIFTKDVFISALEYERTLEGMQYTGTDGLLHNYNETQNGFNIMSPVRVVASTIAGGSNDYNVMIAAIQALPDDTVIKNTAYSLFNPDSGLPTAAMASLLTNDAVFDDSTMTVSAKGCMISVVVVDTLIDSIADGMIGFEKDVSNIANSFVPFSGMRISAIDLNTMMSEIGNMASSDMSKLIPVALILIVVILLLMYRDVVDTLVGLLGLIIAIIWTFGISTALGMEMTTIAIAVPILLLGMGIDYGLHLVFRYREERMEGNDSVKASGRTVNSVGEALVLATVTTAIAFLSYLTSSMTALADFGAMCAIGIVCAFVVMLLIIPAMQSIRDRRANKKGIPVTELKRYRKSESKHGDIIGKVAGIGGRISAKSPWAVIAVTGIALVGFGYGATTLSSEFDMYSFIPDGTEASDTLNYMNDNYSMTTDTTNVLIYGDAWKLETMKAIEGSIDNMNSNHVDGLSYISGVLDEPTHINGVLASLVGKGDAMYDSLYSSAFDGSGRIATTDQNDVDSLRAHVESVPAYGQAFTNVVGTYNGEPVTQIVLNITPEAADGGDIVVRMMNGINAAIAEPFSGTGVKTVTTGAAIVMQINLDEMNDSQMSSLILTLALVLIILTIVMYYTDRSWWLGLMSTIPTLVSVVLVWGTMALLGIPLNVLTLTIASLTVGMGVTYGIHIAHRFVTDLRDNGCEPREAIMTATRETGKGVFGAALTTAVGFGVIGFSAILPLQQFGLITALAIAFGYIGATFILPALLVIWAEHTKPKACDAPKKPADEYVEL